jgi:hypothetical protein
VHVDAEVVEERKKRIKEAFDVFDLDVNGTVIQECVFAGARRGEAGGGGGGGVGREGVGVWGCVQGGADDPAVPGRVATGPGAG